MPAKAFSSTELRSSEFCEHVNYTKLTFSCRPNPTNSRHVDNQFYASLSISGKSCQQCSSCICQSLQAPVHLAPAQRLVGSDQGAQKCLDYSNYVFCLPQEDWLGPGAMQLEIGTLLGVNLLTCPSRYVFPPKELTPEEKEQEAKIRQQAEENRLKQLMQNQIKQEREARFFGTRLEEPSKRV